MGIGVACVMVQVQTLEEAQVPTTAAGADETGALAGLVSAFGPAVVSTQLTLPGLLFSIVLLLSAIYCGQAGRARASERALGSVDGDVVGYGTGT